MKEFISIVSACDKDVFLKSTCANAPDHHLLGLVITFQISVVVLSATGVVSR